MKAQTMTDSTMDQMLTLLGMNAAGKDSVTLPKGCGTGGRYSGTWARKGGWWERVA